MQNENMAIEWWPPERLKPYPGNPRNITPEAIEQVAASLKRFGWRQPIVADAEDVIIVGHTRTLGALKLGLPLVPVHVAADMTPEEAKAYRLADNKVGEATTWNVEALNIELRDLRALDFELGGLGFDIGNMTLGDFGQLPSNNDSSSSAEEPRVTLMDRFGLAPFSVLSARHGWWQDRKRAWIALGIDSELGRGDNHLAFSDTVLAAVGAKVR